MTQNNMSSLLRVLSGLTLSAILFACGGGGGSDSTTSSIAVASSSSGSWSKSASSVVDSSDSSSNSSSRSSVSYSVPQSSVENSVTVTVDGYLSGVNQPFVSVTLCVPGDSSSCVTVDHILVDTGSAGLRLFASAIDEQDSTFVSALSTQTYDSDDLAECMKFGSGNTWGVVKTADLYMAGQEASSLALQIIDDTTYSIPTNCSSGGVTMIDSPSDLSANGILGVGQSAYDCGSTCVNYTQYSVYYTCSASSSSSSTGASGSGPGNQTDSSGCVRTTVPTANQIPNPVTAFSSDNNGVVLVMPSISDSGAGTTTGTLYFGIGTQSNNTIASETIYGTDSYGDFASTVYNGQTFQYGFLDSGSNGFFFPSSITSCSSGWYCPSSTTTVAATITGESSSTIATQTGSVSFSIANADTLFDSDNVAFNNIGATTSTYFDLGMPYFFGRSVFVAIDGQLTPAGYGPYVAF